MQGRIQAVWKTGIPVWAPKLWRPNNYFQVLFFQLYFNKKYIQVAISDFKMPLIILKWLRRQKSRQKRKTMRQKNVEVKEEIVYESVFIHLKETRNS